MKEKEQKINESVASYFGYYFRTKKREIVIAVFLMILCALIDSLGISLIVPAVNILVDFSDNSDGEMITYIKAVFDFDNQPVAGIFINEGKVTSSNRLKVFRKGAEIYFGKIKSLKHYKDDVKELISGQEGGVGVADFTDFKVGDKIEFYN